MAMGIDTRQRLTFEVNLSRPDRDKTNIFLRGCFSLIGMWHFFIILEETFSMKSVGNQKWLC